MGRFLNLLFLSLLITISVPSEAELATYPGVSPPVPSEKTEASHPQSPDIDHSNCCHTHFSQSNIDDRTAQLPVIPGVNSGPSSSSEPTEN